MKTSINAWSVKGDTGFEEMFAQISAAGFDGIELNVDAPGTAHGLYMDMTDGDLAAIREIRAMLQESQHREKGASVVIVDDME